MYSYRDQNWTHPYQPMGANSVWLVTLEWTQIFVWSTNQ